MLLWQQSLHIRWVTYLTSKTNKQQIYLCFILITLCCLIPQETLCVVAHHLRYSYIYKKKNVSKDQEKFKIHNLLQVIFKWQKIISVKGLLVISNPRLDTLQVSGYFHVSSPSRHDDLFWFWLSRTQNLQATRFESLKSKLCCNTILVSCPPVSARAGLLLQLFVRLHQ